MALGVQVVVTDVSKLEDIRKREADITKERIDLILGTGANVILTTKGIDDMALKYFVEAGAIAVRRCKKEVRYISPISPLPLPYISPTSPRHRAGPAPHRQADGRHAHDHAGRHGG